MKTNIDCVFILLSMIFSSVTGEWTHQWKCQAQENLQFNICQDPAHPNIVFFNRSKTCSLSKPFIRHTVSTINDLVDYLSDEMVTFEHQHVKCEFLVQKLQRKSLAGIIDFDITQQPESENKVTNIYMKMVKFLRLFQKLWCIYSTKATVECCLPFSQTYRRLKHRVLSKWWILQNSCGEYIAENQCEVVIPRLPSQDLRCEDIRNMIYILLRDARILLQEARLVAEKIC